MTPPLRPFAPIVHADTRLLLLGSLPGVASLNAGQYYAHPRNGFWQLLGMVLELPLAQLPYAERLPLLQARGVGLWDVIASAHRRGSLDSAIRDARVQDLASFAASLPALRAIGFNGTTAYRLGMRALGEHAPRWETLQLISSSPARAVPLAVKQDSWRQLTTFLQT